MPDTRPCYIGIDIGGTNLRFALVDGGGRIVRELRRQTDIDAGREAFLSRLADCLGAIGAEAAAFGMRPVAVGAGVPGLIANDGFVHVSVNLPAINGINLRDVLADLTGLPVVVANDVNAYAYGERRFGAGQSFASFLMVTLGTGVGGGLVLNDLLWTGTDGVAGEFGHVTVEPEGRSCPCGNHGCLEQYASATAIVAAAKRSIVTGQWPGAPRLAEELTTEMLADAARSGDATAERLFAEAGRYLGIAAASVANLLNLDAVIVGGGVSGSFDLLRQPMVEEIRARAFPIPGSRLKVLRAQLGDDGGMIGAASLAMAHGPKEVS